MKEKMLTLADVVEALTGVRPAGVTPGISEGVVDSRLAIPASLFIAIQGERTDGHEYVAQAFNNGASFALVQRDIDPAIPVVNLRQPIPADQVFPALPFALRVEDTTMALQKLAAFWRRRFTTRVIGITGSVGKSTTKELTAEILAQRFRTLKNQGNFNNEIGLPLTLLRLGPGYDRVVLEMGFYEPGEIAGLCDIALPQVGILTNIGTVHASRAGSQETIARGKSELVRALPPLPVGTAILNIDDPFIREMAKLTEAGVFFYGLDPTADLWADEIESQGLNGIRFRIHHGTDIFNIQAPMIGRHSIHTILAAASAALIEGLTWQEIILGLQHATSQLRLVAVKTRQGALVLDDTYNASPESMLAALNLLNELPGRKIAVLGGMNELGQYELLGHNKVGIRAAEVVDKLIAFRENAQMIAAAAKNAGFPERFIEILEDEDAVIQSLNATLHAGDVVLVKGAHSLRMDRIVQAMEVEE
ncbi:MAG TPA: UDP-N-acetylmuramoyl-tripeptide--D-alanyl-D-alanine ligase [Anaerolineaceae bacterium]|nr:UDP-N-acetylmuramoyl-tripeptide--D-alanyl-D-alanine ligase [Anaerolineaceae bacterium]